MVPPFRQDFSCLAVLRIPLGFARISVTGLSPSSAAFDPVLLSSLCVSWSFNPGPRTGLGFSPFARRYSGNHCCFLFLRLLRCFSWVPLLQAMYSPADDSSCLCRVPPIPTSALSLPYSFTELFAVWRVLLEFSSWQGIRRTPFLT